MRGEQMGSLDPGIVAAIISALGSVVASLVSAAAHEHGFRKIMKWISILLVATCFVLVAGSWLSSGPKVDPSSGLAVTSLEWGGDFGIRDLRLSFLSKITGA